MLTIDTLRSHLRIGHDTSDAEFVASMGEHMARTAYLMVRYLSDAQNRFMTSIELHNRILAGLHAVGIEPKQDNFNPVHWFSSEWTRALSGGRVTRFFRNEYLELFERRGEDPTAYRIATELYPDVVSLLSEFDLEAQLASAQAQLEGEGTFDLINIDDARRRHTSSRTSVRSLTSLVTGCFCVQTSILS